MKQRLIEKKTEEMQQYMGQVKALLSMYLPPDPQKMAQAYQAGKVSLNPAAGAVNLVFRDYAQPGDQMTLSFDTAARKISSVNVSTYMDNPKDGVTLTVQMASLPDGTNYLTRSIGRRQECQEMLNRQYESCKRPLTSSSWHGASKRHPTSSPLS